MRRGLSTYAQYCAATAYLDVAPPMLLRIKEAVKDLLFTMFNVFNEK